MAEDVNTGDLILAIDGGQSTTLALLAAPDGTILGAGLGGPANHVHEPGGMERMRRTLRQVTEGAFAAAGLPFGPVHCACFGMTGNMDAAQEIAREFLVVDTLRVVHDSVTALAGASLAQAGVVVIAGTGAVAYGEDGQGASAMSSGWGYIMGDEGSAYDIGILALRAATSAADGRMPATSLGALIPAYFGVDSLEALHRLIYSQGVVPRPRIAGLAAMVSRAAADGDKPARAILVRAGADLATAAVAVLAQLGQVRMGMPIYPVGGVFRAGQWIMEPFQRALRGASPASEVREPAFAPVIGALLLALRDTGIEPDEAVIERIRATMPPAARSKVGEDGDQETGQA